MIKIPAERIPNWKIFGTNPGIKASCIFILVCGTFSLHVRKSLRDELISTIAAQRWTLNWKILGSNPGIMNEWGIYSLVFNIYAAATAFCLPSVAGVTDSLINVHDFWRRRTYASNTMVNEISLKRLQVNKMDRETS